VPNPSNVPDLQPTIGEKSNFAGCHAVDEDCHALKNPRRAMWLAVVYECRFIDPIG